jgi:hypothetical protein
MPYDPYAPDDNLLYKFELIFFTFHKRSTLTVIEKLYQAEHNLQLARTKNGPRKVEQTMYNKVKKVYSQGMSTMSYKIK